MTGRTATSCVVRPPTSPTTRTGSRPRPGRAAGWWSTGWRGRAGRVPHDRADPARRRVEDDDPPALRPHAERAAGVPARRPGDPRRGHSRRARVHARLRARAAAAPARAQDRRGRRGCGRSRTASCWPSRSRSSPRWRGACTASRSPPAGPHPPGGPPSASTSISSASATAPTSTANPRRNSDCGTRSANIVPSSAPAPVASASVAVIARSGRDAGREVAGERGHAGEGDDHERGGDRAPERDAEPDAQHRHDHEPAADAEEARQQADEHARGGGAARAAGPGRSRRRRAPPRASRSAPPRAASPG